MDMSDFETNLFILASSCELAFWVAGSGRVGVLLFRTHSEQRARASRGQQFVLVQWKSYTNL